MAALAVSTTRARRGQGPARAWADPRPPRGPRGGRRRTTAGFYAVISGSGLALGFTAPITAVLAVQLGASPFMAGVSVASLTAVVLVLDVFGTRALPYLAPRGAIVVGMLVWAAGSFASALAPTFLLMEVSRLVQGVGLALFAAAGPRLAMLLAGPGRVGRALGEFQSAQTLGAVLAPLAGGAVVAVAGGVTGSRAAFAVCGVLALLCALGARLALPAVPASGRPRLSMPALPGLGTRRALLVLANAGAGQGVRAALSLAVIPLVVGGLGHGGAALGMLLTGVYTVECVAGRVGGRWSDRRGRRAPIALGAVCGVLGVLLVIGAHVAQDLVILGASALPLGVAGGLLLAVMPAAVVDLSPVPEVGVSAMRLSRDVGFTILPVVAGALISAGDVAGALWFCAAVLAAVVVCAVAVGETRTG
jgi:MFS transporter, DHA1 family, inner membrane transport protein